MILAKSNRFEGFFYNSTFAITGVQKQSEAALLHAGYGVVRAEPRGDHDLPSIVALLLSRLGHLFGKRIDKLLRKILNACLLSSFYDLPCF